MAGLVRSGIAMPTPGAYGPRMAAAVLRLLTLIALMLMPVGMAGAPAMAQPAPARHAMAGMDHCDDMPAKEQAPPAKMDCTAMCTALPATDAPLPEPVMNPKAPRAIATGAPFAGIVPEIATPPPRRG